MRVILSTLCIIMYSVNALCQTSEPNRMANVVPINSPEASSIQKYGNTPVDYSSGVPKIEFPLCNITSGSLNIPITLSYHAGGIRVQEVAASTGLGFTLFAGGRINRTIIGQEDGFAQFPLYFNTPLQFSDAVDDIYANAQYMTDYRFDDFANKVQQDKLYGDGFSDLYTVFLPTGVSVSFRKDFFTGQFEQSPYKGLKIELNPSGVTGFRITDTEGIVYLFEKFDSSGWNLTKVVGANKVDYIQFIYELDQYNQTSSQQSASYEWGPWITSEPTIGTCWSLSYTTRDIDHKAAPWPDPPAVNSLVTSIESPTQKIQFTYSGRSDPSNYKLDLITVTDKATNGTIKKMGFNYGYFGLSQDNNLRLKLQSFSINPDSSNPETYSFSYYDTYSLPPYYGLTTHNLYHSDYWGFYNGTSSTGNIPYEAVAPLGIGPYTTSKYPDPLYSKTYTIKEVFYPTGGKTLYEFENNEGVRYNSPFYHDGPYGTGKAGGLRVKSIQNFTAQGQLASQKTFEYIGTCFNQVIGLEQFSYQQRYCFVVGFTIGYKRYRTVAVSNPLEELTSVSPSSVFYAYIKEYDGTAQINNGYTEYSYTMPERQENNPYEFSDLHFKHAFQWDYGKEEPLLTNKSIYVNNNNTYQLIKEEQNIYGSLKRNKFPTGINIIDPTTYVNTQDGSYYSYNIDTDEESSPMGGVCGDGYYLYTAWGNKYPQILQAFQTYGYYSTSLLVKKVDISYLNGVAQHEIRKQYEPDYLLLSKQSDVISSGDSVITTYSYPHNFVSQAPYSDMVNTNHIISPVIEQKEYKNSTVSTPVKGTKTNYSYWNNSSTQIYPSTVETISGNSTELRVRYHSYDNAGNVLTVSKESGPKTNYIYGYAGQYPVAKVENVEYSTVESLLGGSSAVDNFKAISSPTDAQVNTFLAPLRANLSSVAVTTYTYSNGLGMTSMMDPRNRKTTYEYNNSHRLSTVKDNDGNIIKQYCYNYAGQQSTCYSIAVPVVVSNGQTIYVRAELENPNVSTGYDNDGYYYDLENADLYFRFYSDAACTQSYTLSSNLDISYVINSYYYYNGGSSPTYYTSGIQASSGSNNYYYGNVETYYYYEYYYDPEEGYYYDSWSYDYYINSGNGYVPEPTYTHVN